MRSNKGAAKLRRYTITQICVVTVMVILILMVWPFSVFQHTADSGYQACEDLQTGVVTMENIVLQPFIPQNNHIGDIRIAAATDRVTEVDRVFVTIYDDAFNQVWQKVVYFTDIVSRGCIRISPDLDVTIGATYYVGLNVHFDSQGTLQIIYGEQSLMKLAECGSFAYANETYDGMAVKMSFRYTAPFSVRLVIACILGILLAGVICYLVITRLLDVAAAGEKRGHYGIRRGALCIFGLSAAGMELYCFTELCIRNSFGGAALDVGVYAAACLTIAVFAGVWICRRWSPARTGNSGGASRQKAAVNRLSMLTDVMAWKNYLQMLCFVFLLQSGIDYVNAPIQWKQDLAARWMLLFFGLSILMVYRKKELWNLFNLGWLVLMLPIGIIYVNLHRANEHEGQIALILMLAVFFWGIVAIRTIRSMISRRRCSLWRPFLILWAVMAVLMMINSHGKSWPFTMVITFTLFYLQDFRRDEYDRMIHNFANGVIGSFLLMLGLCLLFRPYEYYTFNRYPMWFHTVATTGIYLVLVEAVALIRLFIRMRDTHSVVRGAEKEWILHTVIITYIGFSVARTALMSVAAVMLVLAAGAAIVYRPRMKRYAEIAGMLVLGFLISVPVCYTATRCIPAVVHQPHFIVEELEDFKEAVIEEDPIDSYKYMNFKALLRLWGERFGLPEFLTKHFEDTASSENVLRESDLTAAGDGQLSGQPGGLTNGQLSGQPGGLTNGQLNGQPGRLTNGQLNGQPGGQSNGQPGASIERTWLVASAGTVISTDSHTELTNPMDHLTNGRTAIFKIYLKQLNFQGHQSMVYTNPDGSTIAHSHSTFLQAAYDFGIPAGIMFLVVSCLALGRAVYMIWTGKQRSNAMFMALAVICVYLVTGISEYAGNPCMPLCFAYLFSLSIVMRKTQERPIH